MRLETKRFSYKQFDKLKHHHKLGQNIYEDKHLNLWELIEVLQDNKVVILLKKSPHDFID